MSAPSHVNSASTKFLMMLSGLLIFLAPLFMNQFEERLELGAQILGVLMLLVLFWTRESSGKIGYGNGLFIVISLLFVALYLVPFSSDIWKALPGRTLYVDVSNFLINRGVDIAYPALSLIPENTKRSLFYLIPLVALFLVTMSLSKTLVRGLVVVLLSIVFIEVALGIIQYASGSDVFYMADDHGNTASGTYENRDHFVGLIEMSLPLVIGLLVSSYSENSEKRGWLKGGVLSGSLTLLVLITLMLVVSFFSASRAGIGLIVFGVVVSVFVFAKNVGKIKSFGFLVIASVIGSIIAFKVGIVPILNRFASDPMEDERWRILENTKRIISDMYPWGSGPGTFPQVYRAYQPIEQQSFINQAHNDFLEIISDMGLFGAIIIVTFLVLYLLRWVYLMRSSRQSAFINLQIGAGIGMLLMLLHSYVDFNLHQMANALVFVFLAGIFFRLSRQ